MVLIGSLTLVNINNGEDSKLLIESSNKLITYSGKNCFLSNLTSMAKYYDRKLFEENIYANIGHNYHFGEWVDRHEKKYPTLMCFDPDVSYTELINELRKRTISLKRNIFKDVGKAICYIENRIEHNVPIMINVDAFYLNYWPKNIRSHHAHYLIIYGIERESKVWVIDNCIPGNNIKNYKGELDYKLFVSSMNFENVKINHESIILWEIEPEYALDETCKKVDDIVRYDMHSCQGNQKHRAIVGSILYNYFSGTKSLDVLQGMLLDFANLKRKDNDVLLEIYRNIVSFGGPIIMIELLKKYANNFLDTWPLYRDTIRNYNQLLALWKSVGIGIMRYTIAYEGKHLLKAIEYLNDIIVIETENDKLFQNYIPNKIKLPNKAYLYPTILCNLNCKMCYSGSHHDVSIRNRELSLREYKSLIGKLYENGVMKYDISGGEPLMHDQLDEIVSEIKKYKGTEIFLVTNGTMILKKSSLFLEVLRKVNRIYISLDSTNEELHNKIRGSRVAFERAMEGVKFIQSVGYKNLGLNFVAMKENNFEIKKLLDFAYIQGFKFINILRLLDIQKDEKLLYDNLELNSFLSIYEDVNEWITASQNDRFFEITIVMPGYIAPLILGKRKKATKSNVSLNIEFDPFLGCMAYSNSIVISSTGDVTGCTAMMASDRFCVGNIRSNSFPEILLRWDKMRNVIEKREKNLRRKGSCSDCNEWRFCHGGCPAVALKYKDDYNEEDPTCNLIKGDQL